MHHILRTFSDEGMEEVAVITTGTREDNVALATARRASRKASNPPGCTISSVIPFDVYFLITLVVMASQSATKITIYDKVMLC